MLLPSDLEDKQLSKIISEVISANRTGYSKRVTCTIHSDIGDIEILDLMSIDVIKDYVNNYGDFIKFSFRIGLGDYVKFLYPNKDKMEVSIYITGTGGVRHTEQRFRMFLSIDENMNPDGSRADNETVNDLNVGSAIVVNAQLVDEATMVLKDIRISGIYLNLTNEQIIGSVSSQIIGSKTNELDNKLIAIDIDKLDNEKNNTVVIKSGTSFLSLAKYLQYNAFGMYDSGIGSYLQYYNDKPTLFIYPLYSVKRLPDNKKKLNIISIPEDRYQVLDSTFSIVEDTINILVQNKDVIKDNSVVKGINSGNVVDTITTMNRNNMVVTTTRNNRELIVSNRSISARDSIITPTVNTVSTSNNMVEDSKLTFTQNVELEVDWNCSDGSLIYPGMVCTYRNRVNGIANETLGRVLFIHSFINAIGRETSKLILYLNRDEYLTMKT